jgi:hypothetical protein
MEPMAAGEAINGRSPAHRRAKALHRVRQADPAAQDAAKATDGLEAIELRKTEEEGGKLHAYSEDP